jgi:hypothetical protein
MGKKIYRDSLCVYGLARLVLLNEYGIRLPELSDNYADACNAAETARLFTECLPALTAEKIPEPEERAVVIMSERGRPVHMGLVAGSGFILHTGEKTGSVCQRASHPGLRGRIEGYYRVR